MAVVALFVVAVVATAAVLLLRGEDMGWRIEDERVDGDLVADGDTVCGTSDVQVFCLDAANGDDLFRDGLGGRYRALSLNDGVLLVGGTDGLRAYSRDGRELWTMSGSFGDAFPVVDGVVLVRDISPSTVRGIELATGTELWATTFEDGVTSYLWGNPVADGRLAYVSIAEVTGDGAVSQLVALDPATGEEEWRTTLDSVESGTGFHNVFVQDAVSLDDSTTAFVVGEMGRDRRLLTVDTTTGETAWEEPLTDRPAVVTAAHGMIVVLAGEELRGYEADGGLAWTETIPVVPVTAQQETVLRSGDVWTTDGQLYVHTTGVWAVDPRTGEREQIGPDLVGSVSVTRDYVVTADGCCGPGAIEAHPRPI